MTLAQYQDLLYRLEILSGKVGGLGTPFVPLDNYWTIFSNRNIVQQTAPNTNLLAAVLITPKVTGIFRVDVDVGYSDDTTGDGVVWRLSWRQVTVAGQAWVVGDGTAKGFGSPGSSGFIASGQGLTLTAPAGGGSALVGLDQKQIDSVTGLLAHSSQYYGVHGITGTDGGVPFALGRQVALIVEVTSGGAHNITVPSLTLSAQEQQVA
jgi:hypothetical protein